MKKILSSAIHAARSLSSNGSFVRRRHAYEIIGAVIILLCVIWGSTYITPYAPQATSLAITDDSATPHETLYRARISSVQGDNAQIVMLDGPLKGTTQTANANTITSYNTVHAGAVVLVSDVIDGSGLSIIDAFRVPALVVVCAIFILCVLLVGRRRGATSLIGLGISIIVIVWFLIPHIKNGDNPLLFCALSAYMIAFSSIVIAHGIKRRTMIAIACVALLLGLVIIGDVVAVHALALTGISDETTGYLSMGNVHIKMNDVVAGGLVIASLGALDDIVLSQIAAIDELQLANKTLGVRELYSRSLSIGSEHIASLVNTLALLYAGASLPILLTLVGSNANTYALFNDEFVVTAIIQATLPGIALVMAVPFSGIIGAIFIHRMYHKAYE